MRMLWIGLALLLPLSAQAAVEEVRGAEKVAWLVQSHEVPIFTVTLSFGQSGAAYDPTGKEGLAALTASTLDEGAGSLKALAFRHALEDKAIRVGASAGEDTLVVTLEALSEHKDEALKLLTLMLTEPRFDAEAVGRMKKQTLTALRRKQEDPTSVADDAWRAKAWPNHPYGRPSLGTEASVAALTPADLKRFFHEHVARNVMLVAAAGDVTPAELAPFLKTLERALPAQAKVTPLEKVNLQASGDYPLIMPVPQTVVMFGMPGVAREDPRYYAAYLLNHIMGGGELDTRLMLNLRGKEGLVYYAYTSLDTLRYASAWRGGFAASTEKLPQAMQILRTAFADLAHKGVTAEELSDAKRFATGSFPLHISSNEALAGYLISMQYYGLGRNYLEKRNGYLQAVTLEEVNALAKTLAAQAPLTVTVGAKP